MQKTALGAFAAGDAAVGSVKLLIADAEPVEESVHRAAVQLVQQADRPFREVLPGGDPCRCTLRLPAADANQLFRRFRRRRGEHGDIILRHSDLHDAVKTEALFVTEAADALGGVADLAAAVHNEPGLPAAGKGRGADKVPEDMGDLPAVGGADKDPGLFRTEVPGPAFPDQFRRGDQLVLQLFRQNPGQVAAVAGAGIVEYHVVSSLFFSASRRSSASRAGLCFLRMTGRPAPSI